MKDREERMKVFLLNVFGPGEHTVHHCTSSPPIRLRIEDYGLDENGTVDCEVEIIDPDGGDFSLEDVVHEVEWLHNVVGKYDQPDATPEEYEALKASIDQFGVRLPIIVDEHNHIIDGRLRKRACNELGINCPTEVISNLSVEQKRQLALELDFCRKQVAKDGRQEMAKVFLRGSPWKSDRFIGRASGLDHHTVGTIRSKLERGGEIPHVDQRHGKDGKRYRFPSIRVSNPTDVRRARSALKYLGDDAPNKPMELRCAERGMRQKKKDVARGAELPLPTPDDAIQLFHTDFRQLEVEDGSAAMVFTDPPYPKEFLPVWADLSAFAARVLRPGGVLVTYTGQMYLDQILASLSRHLTFHWQAVLLHDYNRQTIHFRHALTHYKPILLYVKEFYGPEAYFQDVFVGAGKDKTHHEWQQAIEEAVYFIKNLTKPGDLIVDPFGGGFTTAEAVLRVGGRRFLGCDIDKACVVRGIERLAKARAELSQQAIDGVPQELPRVSCRSSGPSAISPAV